MPLLTVYYAVWMLGNGLADDLDLHRGVEHGQWHWPSALVQYTSSAPIKTTRYSSKTVPMLYTKSTLRQPPFTRIKTIENREE